MQKFIIKINAAVLLLGAMGFNAVAQKKLAQTGFEFLSVGINARATAMGEAYTTFEGSSASLFYNPAGMARLPGRADFIASHQKWIADIKYFSGTLALNPAEGAYGVFGLSFQFVDYGDLLGTVVAENEQGYEITGKFSPSALMAGLGYAKALSDRFAVGGQVKYVVQSLGTFFVPVKVTDRADSTGIEEKYAIGVLAFDFGTLYKTGFKSFAFGMSVRNFSREIKYEREGFQLPLTFKIGFAMDALDLLPNHPEGQSFLLSVDAVHPRSFPEYLSCGGEYKLLNTLALRGGYVFSQNDYGVTAGFGIQKFGLAIDYSYTPYETFNDINRVSVQFLLK